MNFECNLPRRYFIQLGLGAVSAHLDDMTEPFYFGPVLKVALLADLHIGELS